MFGIGGLFGRHLDGIAVERRLHGHAIRNRAFGRGALLREVEGLREIDVARLVIRRRGVRDVRREHHHALAAQLERSEEHTSELQSLMRISYAVFCLKKKTIKRTKEETY